MKSFKEYLSESEYYLTNPVEGDEIAFNLKEDTLVESYVIESNDDRVVVAADQAMIDIFESFGYEVEEICNECYESTCECGDQSGEKIMVTALEDEDEDEDDRYPAYNAILNRIIMQHPTLLAQYGPDKVMDAAREEAMFYGDADELGTSDISALVKRVEQSLEHNYDARELAETDMEEAKYQGREVPLNKPMKGDVKKSKVYVKDPKTGNIKKVNFGDKKMRIKKSNPKRRKSFRARHNCANPGPKTKARYWSCRAW